MTILSKFDILEATRLTREGKLQQALAVLQGALTGKGASPATCNDVRPQAEGKKSVIEMLPRSPQTAPRSAGSSAVPFGRLSDGHGSPDKTGGLFGRTAKPTPSHPANRGTFEEGSFTNAAGTRSYKVYVPSRYDGQPVPFVVMLHGCTQSPDDFAAGTRMNEIAEEKNFIAAYPAQSPAANSSKCWNWFNGSDQRRGHGEPSLIAGITHQIMDTFSIDAGRIYVAGMSAGGAAAAIMANTYPDLYAAIGVHSGLPFGAAMDVPSAFAAMKHGGKPLKTEFPSREKIIPTIVFHGDADRTVNPMNGDDIIAQANRGHKLETAVNQGQSVGGMNYTRIVQTDVGGRPLLEQWLLHGAGHAWSGGSALGSFTDTAGPDASREMIRFFMSV